MDERDYLLQAVRRDHELAVERHTDSVRAGQAYLLAGGDLSELLAIFGVSRATWYRWAAAYGDPGLRRRKSHE